MRWTVDGKPFAERRLGDWETTGGSAPNAPFDRPFYPFLNLAVGGGLAEGRNRKIVDPATFPACFDIDCVSVWQCRDPAASSVCRD